MPRNAVAVSPTYNEVRPLHDAYLSSMNLRPLAKKYGRYWEMRQAPTTVALPDGCFAKSYDSFQNHRDESTFRELLNEYSFFDCPRPSSYADVFHARFESPIVCYSVNATLAPVFCGGWQQAMSVGNHRGVWRKYDLRSAYLWAATLGLPDTSKYRRSLEPWRDQEGIYRVKLVRPVEGMPTPFNRATDVLATNLEIETYNLPIAEVLDGLTWQGTVCGEKIIDVVRQFTTWKQIGRSYWGRWAQTASIHCVTKKKTWPLRNRFINIPWAHSIVSRVKMKLWEYADRALHVYVDSVITKDLLPTGDAIGDWRLEKTYDNGVFIRGPGQYGPAFGQLERQAGIVKTIQIGADNGNRTERSNLC